MFLNMFIHLLAKHLYKNLHFARLCLKLYLIMWKSVLLVAVVANLAIEHGTTARFSGSGGNRVNEYKKTCSEINEGYNYNDLKNLYNQAVTDLSGKTIYEWQQMNEGVSQLSSVNPLVLQLSILSQYADDVTRSQLYKVIFMNNQNEVKSAVPKIANEYIPINYGFVSTFTTKIFGDVKKDFSEDFKNCYSDVMKGETGVLDYSNLSAAAEQINSWFGEQTRFDRVDVVTAADIPTNDDGFILTSCQSIEFEFEDFTFSKLVNISFFISEENVTMLPVWEGEGKAKYSYNDQLQADVVQLPLKGDHALVIIKPQIGHILDLLFYLRDTNNFANLLAESQDTYVKLLQPLNNYAVRSHDNALALKQANILTPMFDRNFDGFSGILEEGSGYISNIFHQMHMTIKGLGQEATTTASTETTKEIVINSGFAFCVIDSTGTPQLRGTHLA